MLFRSGLCSRRFTATQYALLSSVPQLAIHTIGAQSGKLVAAVGWTEFYALCIVTALPAMGLMLYLLRKCPPEDAVAKA